MTTEQLNELLKPYGIGAHSWGKNMIEITCYDIKSFSLWFKIMKVF